MIKRLLTAFLMFIVLLGLPAAPVHGQATTNVCPGGSIASDSGAIGEAGECNVLDPACKVNPTSELCRGNAATRNETLQDNSIYGRNGILTKAARIISMILGVAAIIVLIIAGLRYSLASGDPANVTKARNTVTYALVGIAVAAAAQSIIVLVLDKIP